MTETTQLQLVFNIDQFLLIQCFIQICLTWVLQRFKNVEKGLQSSSKGCSKVYRVFKHVSNLFQECYNAFMFSGCFLGVSGIIEEEFSNEDVLKK